MVMHKTDTISKLVPLRSRTDPLDDSPQSRRPLAGSKTTSKSKGGHSYRQAAKDTVQSALELRPPITFEHLLRRDRRTPNHSRRNSLDIDKQDDLKNVHETSRLLRKQVGRADVSKLARQNEQGEQELRQALHQIEKQGTQYTRQLDETYYALLERGEALRQVLRNLQSLAEQSRSVRSRFDSEASRLEDTIKQDTDSYHNFDEQEEQIRSMLAQLDKSKDRAAQLNVRLDTAREKVSAAENRVLHDQSQRRKRWQATWGILGATTVILLGIWIARRGATSDLTAYVRASLTNVAKPGRISSSRSAPSEDKYLNMLFDGIS